jgi:hypothetical protein
LETPVANISLRIGVRHNFAPFASRLGEIPSEVGDALQSGVSSGTELLGQKAFSTIPKKTGRTAGTIRTNVVGLTGRVFSEDDVAYYLEEGTSAHDIPLTPKPLGTALRFTYMGQVMYRRQVHVSGIKALHWLYRSGEESDSAIKQGFDERMSNIFGRV